MQDDPQPDEFKFTASPENSSFIQASIETGRLLFPSLETHIQVAEAANILEEERRRGNFPSYMRDASPFEIYKIYRGEAANRAKIFLNRFLWFPKEGDIEGPIISRLMNERGYIEQYIGYISANHAAGQARRDYFPLIPGNFVASLTPDQEILMEEWRLQALKSGVAVLANIDFLGLRDIRAQYTERTYNDYLERKRQGHLRHQQFLEEYPLHDVKSLSKPPVLQTIGFSVDKLRTAILDVARRINNPHTYKHKQHYIITRDYIKYEGEKAELTCGHKKYDITDLGLPLNREIPKAYYMMN